MTPDIPEMVERCARAIHENALKFYLAREGIRPATFEEVWTNFDSDPHRTLEAQARAAIEAMRYDDQPCMEATAIKLGKQFGMDPVIVIEIYEEFIDAALGRK